MHPVYKNFHGIVLYMLKNDISYPCPKRVLDIMQECINSNAIDIEEMRCHAHLCVSGVRRDYFEFRLEKDLHCKYDDARMMEMLSYLVSYDIEIAKNSPDPIGAIKHTFDYETEDDK